MELYGELRYWGLGYEGLLCREVRGREVWGCDNDGETMLDYICWNEYVCVE